MSKSKLKFKVSSALKTIIGKELITNDYIAVFELVKNSFDANASRVDIEFKDIAKGSPNLVITDNGKGMDKTDLVEKWLFVAYSAKKLGREDYRDKIASSRVYAGSKGIGRFSCDKLGSKLIIFSRKKGKDQQFHRLTIDWNDFELDAENEFVNIPVDYETLPRIPHDLKHGTILEISKLRETDWDSDKLLRLKRSLEKLINPNQGNDSENFSIYLKSQEDIAEDRKAPKEEPWKKVNGKIENFLFENLKIKTTNILTRVSENGEEITTRLMDRGRLIYEIKESNPYENSLKDVSIQLFVLNRAAKNYFTKTMGVQPVKFGSVFLYKNGFRVYPFGDEGEDILGIDRRKQQGQARHIGTRDLIGRIEINGPNDSFQETSSRDGGLVRNSTFENLKKYFYDFALRRLEKFTIDVIKWGNIEPETLGDEKAKIFEIITSLTKSKDVLDLRYDPGFLDIMENISENSVSSLLRNFSRIAQETGNDVLKKEAEKAQTQLDLLAKAKEEAELETEQAREEAWSAMEEVQKARTDEMRAREKVKEKTSQNLFLQSVMSKDLEQVICLHHHIGISAGTIENYVKDLARKIQKGKPVTTDMIQSALQKISFQARKISTTVGFATKANFRLDAVNITDDIISFFKEYIFNVCSGLVTTFDGKDMKFKFKGSTHGKFDLKFKPIEASIVMDNLISNSRKAKAKNITLDVLSVTKDSMEISFKDNGKGILKQNIGQVFDMGFTTTNGSGLGLHHVRNALNEMNGQILVNPDYKDGAEFLIKISK